MSFHKQLADKILSKEVAFLQLDKIKLENKKIVFTNGCFDILHPGHVDYLSQARDLGDFLILGLNTDYSVKKLNKAPNRPINSELARACVLAALACIDAIVLFDEETPYDLISFLKPNILVKGDDYQVEKIVGYDVVKANGGKIVTIPFLKGYSTTELIKKIVTTN
jgi:D-glycero-beta-D-manno-heptose 1-phosphate adenylyltransferase